MSLVNGTSTSVFLSCTTPPPAGGMATVTGTQTVFTTVYQTVLKAACPTSQWMATYTITETCTGNQAAYTPAATPRDSSSPLSSATPASPPPMWSTPAPASSPRWLRVPCPLSLSRATVSLLPSRPAPSAPLAWVITTEALFLLSLLSVVAVVPALALALVLVPALALALAVVQAPALNLALTPALSPALAWVTPSPTEP